MNRVAPFLLLTAWSCAAVNPSAPKVTGEAVQTVAEFKRVNRPHIVDGLPRPSNMPATERAHWCRRLLQPAQSHLQQPGDTLSDFGPCAVSLTPARPLEGLANVTLRFDVDFFFERPWAAASFNREKRTIFLPLSALTQPWPQTPETIHELRHATLWARAVERDAAAQALMSTAEGPEFAPDAFNVDEVRVNLCDWLTLQKQQAPIEPWRRQLLTQYLQLGKQVIDDSAALEGTPQTRFGIEGTRISTSHHSTVWLGGTDAHASRDLLRRELGEATVAFENRDVSWLDTHCEESAASAL